MAAVPNRRTRSERSPAARVETVTAASTRPRNTPGAWGARVTRGGARDVVDARVKDRCLVFDANRARVQPRPILDAPQRVWAPIRAVSHVARVGLILALGGVGIGGLARGQRNGRWGSQFKRIQHGRPRGNPLPGCASIESRR